MPNYEIKGEDMQVLRATLGQEERVYVEGGHLLMKEPQMRLEATARGGLLRSLGRSLTGGSFFVLELMGPGSSLYSGFAPGKIVQIGLRGESINVEHSSFLLAEETVEYGSSISSLSTGVFSGQGIFLANFRGSGNVFLHAVGGVEFLNLGQGQSVQVEAGHVLAFDSGMPYSVSRIGSLKTMFLGGLEGEGFFFVTLTGPGRVWLHSVSVEQLAARLAGFRTSPPAGLGSIFGL